MTENSQDTPKSELQSQQPEISSTTEVKPIVELNDDDAKKAPNNRVKLRTEDGGIGEKTTYQTKNDDECECQFCSKSLPSSKLYICPKCNVKYCTLACYRSPLHLSCSESFYRESYETELAYMKSDGMQEAGKESLMDKLKRVNQEDGGSTARAGCSNIQGEDVESESEDETEIQGGVDLGELMRRFLTETDIESVVETELDENLSKVGLVDTDINSLMSVLTEKERREFEKLTKEMGITSGPSIEIVDT